MTEKSAVNVDKSKFPAHEQDLQERIDGFNKELTPLLGKFELTLVVIPQFTPDGRVTGSPLVVSTRKDPNAKEDKPATPLAEG